MCVLIVESTPVRCAWNGDETKRPKNRRRKKAGSVEQLVEVRKPSLADLDRQRFYPTAASRHVFVRPETSRLALAAKNQYDECEDIPVVGSAQRVRMLPSDEKKGRKHVCRRIGIGKRMPVTRFIMGVNRTIFECEDYHYVGGQKRSARMPEYKDRRSSKFRGAMKTIIN